MAARMARRVSKMAIPCDPPQQVLAVSLMPVSGFQAGLSARAHRWQSPRRLSELAVFALQPQSQGLQVSAVLSVLQPQSQGLQVPVALSVPRLQSRPLTQQASLEYQVYRCSLQALVLVCLK
jgi:hypothetical protein